jgi:Carboxypeptidase regulatory-like domain/TonB-dependent Receptor Plug Domain
MQLFHSGFLPRSISVDPRRERNPSATSTLAKLGSALIAFLCLVASAGAPAFGQGSASSGTIQGTVLDPSGAALKGAKVEVRNPVSGYEANATTDDSGRFQLTNIPYNPYHLVVSVPGFGDLDQDVQVRSPLPIDLKLALQIATSTQTVTVQGEATDLLEQTPTFHTDVDRKLFDKMPLESSSSSVSSLVTLATPGIAADSNGLFHGLGDHASNSFSVDGQPITDQQSKVFSNQIPVDAVQSLEVIAGAPPAEYGDKTSLVIVATTRSGQGVNPPRGNVTASYGSFGSSYGGFDLAYGGQKWGNFIAANGMNTTRFLDPPELTVMHSYGNLENVFDRFDIQPSTKNTLNFNFQFTRSWFQTPNSYDAQNATAWSGLVVDDGGLGPNGLPVGSQDQHSQIKTFDIAPTWSRLINANTVFTLNAFVRRDEYNYYPSANPFADLTPDLQFQTVGQNRKLTNAGGIASLAYVKSIHHFKAGVMYEDTILTENDSFGIVDPTLNPVCLNADGSPNTNPTLTNPANCTAPLQVNPNSNPVLACHDLTRTASLPASDGCPNSTSDLYAFNGHANIREIALYAQDTISAKNWTFNLGLRGDLYRGITSGNQAEPRLGLSYNIPRTNTVLMGSYAHTFETPFNENLVLASIGCLDPYINAITAVTQGYPCLERPLSPGTRNEFHLGLQQAFKQYLVVSGEYIWKYTDGAYDFSVLGNTPITFPIEWTKSKIPGYAIHVSVPNHHGFTAFVVMSSVAARFFEPQISGIGVTPPGAGGTGVFRIDHDEHFNQTTHLQYQPWKRGPWVGFNWRYDSGLVAGPVPCAGGNCANGPLGSDSVVDASIITPDQQFQAGLSCNGVFATPTTPISLNSVCPANQYASKYVSIPAPGTENDDHNPPRIASRNLFDLAVGFDNIFKGDKRTWSARVSIVNLSNKEALYNFISTFSGTHYVTPRAVTGEIAFHF